MRGYQNWSYRPYTRLNETEKAALPTVCRLAPGKGCFDMDWFDAGAPDAAHTLEYRVYKSLGEWTRVPLTGSSARVENLQDEQDYELRVVREDGAAGELRLVRTGYLPGTIVNYLHPEDARYAFSGRYLCSPCIARTKSGRLLLSMDLFAGNGPQTLTLLYKSDDGGEHWAYMCDMMPCYWGTMFLQGDRVYMLSASTEYGDLLLGYSEDDGEHWSAPVCLFRGGGLPEMGIQRTAMPIIEHQGRFVTSVDYGSWNFGGFGIGLLSAPVNADLMKPENWSLTPFWKAGPEGTTCLEGNAVIAPDGSLLNMLRINGSGLPPTGEMVVLRAGDDPESPLTLDRIAPFNGGHTKFYILRDEATGKYVCFHNEVTDERTPGMRSVLSMCVSDDLLAWKDVLRVIDYRRADAKDVGFQYPTFIFDGDDILLAVRGALNRAHNFHDANHTSFFRIRDFRRYTDC